MFSTVVLFNKAFRGQEIDYSKISKLACKLGYLIHPDCCTQEVFDFLTKQKIDYRSTFHQIWKDITAKNGLQSLVDQTIYYFSYDERDFQGELLLPERIAQIPDLKNFKDFKVILPITEGEAISRCENMLASGIALSEETIAHIFHIFGQCQHAVNIDIIKNKEAKMLVCKQQGLLPNEPTEMLRYLVYLATDKTLLIKNKETVENIKKAKLKISDLVKKFGEEKLSSIFLRFKPLFLAFKPANKELINKLRRLAVKNHQAIGKGYFEDLLNNFQNIDSLPQKLKEINNFKKITLLEAIKLRQTESAVNSYLIRNGKLWTKERNNEDSSEDDSQTLDLIYSLVYDSLVDSLKTKTTTVKLPKGIDLKLPKSEKSFVGNLPLGTTIDLVYSQAIIGIHWREADGANDLDLKLIDIIGTQFGWNANYYNRDETVIYSGDMTSAKPEAAELFYAADGFKPSIVKVNMYSGEDKSKFKFFLAREKIEDAHLPKNYMVDPNNILFSVEMEMESREMSLGIITADKFLVSRFRTGKKQVAGNSITNQYIQYALDTQYCFVSLEQLLFDAGFTIVGKWEEAKIDLSKLTKDSLIELLR